MQNVSGEFLWRRIHSMMGFWLVLYIMYHLLVNSQAALWLGESGSGFIRMVNTLESLPYLHAVEIALIGIPFLVHGIWGIQRIFRSKSNVHGSEGNKPSLPFGRNIAYTLQRWTSWILLIGVIGHVVQMRFVDAPKKVGESAWMVQVTPDDRLAGLSEKLDVALSEKNGEMFATASSPGKAMLLMVRNTFKSPLMGVLYTIFVLSAAFHAFNGFWTFLITWGVILSYRSQKASIPVCFVGMLVLAFFGLAAIWGSYWLS